MTADLGSNREDSQRVYPSVGVILWVACALVGIDLDSNPYGLFRYCMESEMIGNDFLINVICTLQTYFRQNKQLHFDL